MPLRRTAARSAASPSPSAPSPMARSLALAFGAFGGLMVAATPVPLRAQTLPQGGVVVNGQASISQAGNKLTVTNTPGAAINWQSFNIGAGNGVHFQQQSAASSVLNRVVGPDPSAIYGALTSNGRVVLINPAGIAFGAGAAVDTAGFIASTVNISDADWRAGRLRFAQPGAAGNISLAGANGQTPAANIRAQGGDIVLIAPQVDIANGAVAHATGGDVIIAAGRSVELTGRGYEGIRLLVQAPTDQATNLGKLEGDAVAIFARSLKNLGTVRANGATVRDGRVMLVATDSAEVGGQISASKTVSGQQTGGKVTVLGNAIHLQGAQIDASGSQGGGQVHVGGNWQGQGNPLADAPQALAALGGAANAQNTHVDAQTTINASATQSGNGGQVVVWADGRTDFAGSIASQGGSLGGDGGNVEVSGKQTLKFADSGFVDTRAPSGRTGNLLLDPSDFTIASGVGSLGVGDVGALTLAGLLTASNMSLAAGNDLFVNAPVAWSSGNALTLTAGNNVNLNADLLSTSLGAPGGGIQISAGTGSIVSVPNSTIQARHVTLAAGQNLSLQNVFANGGAGQSGGSISLHSSGGGAITVAALDVAGGVATLAGATGGQGGTVRLSSGGTSDLVVSTATNCGTLACGINAKGGGGAFSGGAGGQGGSVTLQSGGSLELNSLPIVVEGGFGGMAAAGPLPASGGAGGQGGSIRLEAGTAVTHTLTVQNLTLPGLEATGGSGGFGHLGGAAGAGGQGGVINFSSGGLINLQNSRVLAWGALGRDATLGSAGGAGGNGGLIAITSSLGNVAIGGGSVVTSIPRVGGIAAGSLAGGANGAGGSITIQAAQGNVYARAGGASYLGSQLVNITARNDIDVYFVGSDLGGVENRAKNGGTVSLVSQQGGQISIVDNDSTGDRGIAVGGGSGYGSLGAGQGGTVVIRANAGDLSLSFGGNAQINAYGGGAEVGSGGNGAQGGQIAIISAGSLTVANSAFVYAQGGEGAVGSTLSSNGGAGGVGGSFSMASGGGLGINAPLLNIDVSGGQGRTGNAAIGGAGGNGGNAGSVRVTSAAELNWTGQVSGNGGQGGDGTVDMAPPTPLSFGGGAGGAGATVSMSAAGGSALTFNGRVDAFGRDGGNAGANPMATTGGLAGAAGAGGVVTIGGAGTGDITLGGTSYAVNVLPGFAGQDKEGYLTFPPVTMGSTVIHAAQGNVSVAGKLYGSNLAITANNDITLSDGFSTLGQDGRSGGNVNLTSNFGGTIAMGSSIMDGGDGFRTVAPGAGGNLLVRNLAGNLNVTGDISARGGSGEGGFGLAGATGGNVTVDAAGALTTTGLMIAVNGGDGAAAPSTVAASGGNGGNGGTITVMADTGINAPALYLNADGGASGVGGDPDPITGVGALSGTGGTGGVINISSGGGTVQLNGLWVAQGGAGADGGYAVGGAGGNGGTVNVSSNGDVLVTGSLYAGVRGGQGGSGGLSNAFGVPPLTDVAYGGGAGGHGGSASIRSNGGGSLTVGGPLTIDAYGGMGGDAGQAPSPSFAPAVGGVGGNAGMVALGSPNTQSVVLNGVVTVVQQPGFQGLDSSGVDPGNSGIFGALQLASGAGGISTPGGSFNVPGNLQLNSSGFVDMAGSVQGLSGFAGTGLSFTGVLSAVNGPLGSSGDISIASGSTLHVTNTISTSGSIGLSSGLDMNISGNLSALGGVSLASGANLLVQPGASVQGGGPVRLSASNDIYVGAVGGATSTRVDSLSTVDLSADQIFISGGAGAGADAQVSGELGVTVNALSALYLEGGSGTNASALLASVPVQNGVATLPSPTSGVAINAASVILSPGTGVGAYAGLVTEGNLSLGITPVSVASGPAGAFIGALNGPLVPVTFAGTTGVGTLRYDSVLQQVTFNGVPWAGTPGLVLGEFVPNGGLAGAPTPVVAESLQILLTLQALLANPPAPGAPPPGRRTINGIVVSDENCSPGG